jgi:hypothetical protein
MRLPALVVVLATVILASSAVSGEPPISIFLRGGVGTVRADKVWEHSGQVCWESRGHRQCVPKDRVNIVLDESRRGNSDETSGESPAADYDREAGRRICGAMGYAGNTWAECVARVEQQPPCLSPTRGGDPTAWANCVNSLARQGHQRVAEEVAAQADRANEEARREREVTALEDSARAAHQQAQAQEGIAYGLSRPRACRTVRVSPTTTRTVCDEGIYASPPPQPLPAIRVPAAGRQRERVLPAPTAPVRVQEAKPHRMHQERPVPQQPRTVVVPPPRPQPSPSRSRGCFNPYDDHGVCQY